jgi:hypothetical protein
MKTRIPKEKSLLFLHPCLSTEWNYEKNIILKPERVFAYSSKKVWWKCKIGHEWESTICNRSNGSGCPYCSNNRASKDNCLLMTNPKLSLEWNYDKNYGLTPNDVTANSHKKIWWKCTKGHEWESIIANRNSGKGCPYCSGQKVCKDNCLATINPELSKEWDFSKNVEATPEKVTPYNNAKVWWKCKNGHEWQSVIADRSNGNGCPNCNKIEFSDGIICDSLPEAYYYLKLKEENVDFIHHPKLGLGKCICDFYLIKENQYVEVTGFSKQWKYWRPYLKQIAFKKRYVKKLNANFEFVQIKLCKKQIQYIRKKSLQGT